MKLETKQSADLSSRIQSSYRSWQGSVSDEEEPDDDSDFADSEGQNDEDMRDALHQSPMHVPQVSSECLELFAELRGLFKAPKCLLIRSSYKTLHEALMSAAEKPGERHGTVDCYCLFPA